MSTKRLHVPVARIKAVHHIHTLCYLSKGRLPERLPEVGAVLKRDPHLGCARVLTTARKRNRPTLHRGTNAGIIHNVPFTLPFFRDLWVGRDTKLHEKVGHHSKEGNINEESALHQLQEPRGPEGSPLRMHLYGQFTCRSLASHLFSLLTTREYYCDAKQQRQTRRQRGAWARHRGGYRYRYTISRCYTAEPSLLLAPVSLCAFQPTLTLPPDRNQPGCG
mmetsp:Transcript_39181/g.70175  ORF Transcript_39181/g.70175 Transcript_39181/m.70175 type:complete len:220 (-) Transcript_39181:66-725(-)